MPILGSQGSTKGPSTAPTIGSASGGSSGVVSVTFSAPSFSKLPITSYTVTSSSGRTGSGSSSPVTVNEVTGGTYTYTVRAVHANGTSAASSASNAITSSFFSATGGEIVTVGSYNYHVFTANGTFAPNGSKDVSILVVGAGGGGGCNQGGGGGGGSIQTTSPYWTTQNLTAGSYSVTIGAGGTGSASDGSKGTSGTSAVFTGSSTITALGGGGGGSQGSRTGATGGSGGGSSIDTAGGNASGPNTNNGGMGYAEPVDGLLRGMGGGGGATATGGNGSGSGGGNGGQGLSLTTIDSNLTSNNFTSFSGMTVIASGGGGSGYNNVSSAGSGGTGAGNGTNNASTAASASSYGSGGGGGGRASGAQGNGGNGKQGLIIVRYTV